MQKAFSWRELLKDFIRNPAERERIATEVGVHPLTLQRWTSGESIPRPHNLKQLLAALPKQYRDQFRSLLEEDALLFAQAHEDALAPGLPPALVNEPGLPPALVNEVLETRASSPDILHYWTICRQVLQHALRQLDPDPVGMAITVVRCMPPTPDGKIHSLRENIGLGNAPWESDLEPKALFLGADSLAGHMIQIGRYEQIPDLRMQSSFLPAYQTAYEVSAAACPIKYARRVAGCLLLSSTQPDYFFAEARRALIQSYANLLALAFEPEEFYPLELIQLALMPPLEVQQSYFVGYRQRVIKLMRESTQTGHPLTMTRAEELAWQQIEAILLQLPTHTTESHSEHT
jgi:hypothetical protein